MGIVTALCPHIGYSHASRIAKQALAEQIPVRELILGEKILTEEELDQIPDVYSMTKPGISGKKLPGHCDRC